MTDTFTITLPWWIAALFAAAAALSVVSDILRIYIMQLEKRIKAVEEENPRD